MYVPDADYFGLDSFAYVSDSQPASSASAEVVVAITVHAVNDRPRVTFASEGLTTPKNTPVSVVIKGEDIDGPGAATAMITALPQSGLLFQADGSAIVGTPTAVTSPEGAVLYTPEANGFGAPFDSFSFVITDSVASSEEHTVEITVTPDMAEVLVAESEMHAGLVLPAEYTMEVWVKALHEDPGAAAGRRLHGYQLTREYQAAAGGDQAHEFFNFTTPGVGVPGMDLAAAGVGVSGAPLTVLDGQWHHVAAVVKDSLKMVYIDGQLDTSQSFAPTGAGVDSLVSVFYASLGHDDLVGVVDDFKVWSYAKSLQDLRQSLHTPVAGYEAGLLVHDDFAYGSYYVSSPIAGEAGYAVETSADEYIWFDSYPEWQILHGWSISAWFKTSAVVSDYASLVTKGAFLGTMGLGGEWALQWTREGGLGFHICEYCTSSNPQQVIASANSYNLYNDGYWHHVAGTFDPALKTIAIYVDGQLPAGAKSLAPISNLYLEDQGSRITVGRDDKGSEQSIFFGQVDEISVFDYPLNKAEVISLSRHADVAERTFDGPNGGTGKRVTWKLNTPASLAVRAEQGAGEAGTASSVAAFKPSTLSIPTDLRIVGFGVSQVVPLYGADQDGDRLEYLITEVPAKGQLFFTENGALGAQVLRAGVATAAGPLIYVSGEDDEAGGGPYATFKYAVTDGREVSADVEMRIFVFGKNKAPTVALAAPVETLEEAAVTVTLLVADKEGHDVTVAVAGGPTNGQVSTSLITKGEDGSFTFVYTPNPDFYGVDVVTVVATDSQGTSALPFDVLITVKGVNDGPVVTAPPSIEMTFEEMVLPGISVADVDAENAVLTATLTTTVGFLSAVSIADAKASKLLQVTVSGQLEELNDKLGKIFIYNEAMVAGTITLTVTDNGGTGLGGPVLVTVEIPVTTKILPILSAHITNNLLGIRAKYRFPSDGLTSVDGDCSAVLMSDTIKRIGPSACALNGQGAGCPVCTFSTPTDLSVIFGTDPTIMPGDSVVFKAGVVSIACGPGDAADGCVTGPQPVMTVVLQPPTERIPPVVTITGPA